MRKSKQNFILLVFSLLITPSSLLWGQPLKLQVIEKQTSQPIAYITLWMRGEQIAVSDQKGECLLPEASFCATDTLYTRSSFYRDSRWRIEQLQANQGIIALTPIEISLQEVSITGYDPMRLAACIGKYFVEKSPKLWNADFLYARTVQSHGIYREFNALQGSIRYKQGRLQRGTPQWREPQLYNLYFRTALHSYPLMANQDEILEIHNRRIPQEKTQPFASSPNFNNSYWVNLLNPLRTLQLYTPLNPKSLQDFRYTIDSLFTNAQGEETVILAFTSKPNLFPAKTKFFGRGRVWYNTVRQHVVQIEVENYLDYYTNFARTKEMLPMAHHQRLVVRFQEQGTQQWLHSISWRIQWIDTQEQKEVYFATPPARPHPYRHRIIQTYTLLFSNYNHANLAGASPNEEPPFDRIQWEHLDQEELPFDLQKVRRDLFINQKTLEDQAAAFYVQP